jgi:hypothetical protein
MVINIRISTFMALDIAAKNREMVLRNSVLKAQRQTQRGVDGETKAYVIPAEQHDPLTAHKLVDKLMGQGITVDQARSEFVHEGRVYGAGTYLVSMAQPKRGVIRWLLGQTFYPQNSYTRRPDGSPIRPYDMSGDVLAEFMGVDVVPISSNVETALSVVRERPNPAGAVTLGSDGYLLQGSLNDAFRAVNLLWDRGVTVHRFVRDHGPHRAGDFWVPAASADVVSEIAAETGVPFLAMNVDAGDAFAPESQRLRVGMYQRYYGGNMDEGWTRLLLEQFDFKYTTIMDADVLGGDLSDDFDVIILPSDDIDAMMGRSEEDAADTPPEYRSGMGEEGAAALEEFVEAGGTLVTFASAGDLPIQEFGLDVRNVVADVPNTEFWAQGSTLKVDIDTDHPLAWGMPEDGLVVFFGANQVYEVQTSRDGEGATRVASYIDRDILQSGQLDGEDLIAERAAMLAVEHGEGQVVLIGFRTQHRAQTHGTYKFLFNALVGSR